VRERVHLCIASLQVNQLKGHKGKKSESCSIMKELYSVPTSPFTALSPLAASPSLSLPGGFRTSPYSLTDSIKSFSVRGSFSSSLPVAASVGEGEEVVCGVTGEGGGGGTPSLRAMAFSMSIRKERSSVEEGSKERPRVIALMRYKEGKV
jgi:hypothetical protein